MDVDADKRSGNEDNVKKPVTQKEAEEKRKPLDEKTKNALTGAYKMPGRRVEYALI